MKKNKKIKIALSGDRGRMGKSLKRLIKKDPSKEFVSGANRDRSLDHWDSKKIDAVIDFSLPPLFSKTLLWCVQNKKPFVSGTTGLNSRQKRQLKESSKRIPIFYSENMGWGVFLLTKYISQLSNDNISILVEDIHHKGKKDKPSGTALKLKKHLPSVLQKKIKMKSYRRGCEFGTHRVFIKTPEEILLLEHKALSRDVFSKGALKALDYILKKSKGLYSLSDIYG